MGRTFARTMFGPAAKLLQAAHGSRASYERLAELGPLDGDLGPDEIAFLALRDSFYLATTTPDGWPYVQHRGGPAGFLHVLNPRTLAFADLVGNKQYISTGNVATNDRVALFLMDYPHQTRLKIIGHARILEPGADPHLETLLKPKETGSKMERLITIQIAGFDWNCPQHITPRFTMDEISNAFQQEPSG
jgi:predicted pyridoxine 5'-phosphate oxidase superfamily flavin-nucleotide-binding protein